MAIVDGSTSSQYWDYRVVATELSRNIASNYTRIRFDVQITRIGSSSYIQGHGSISLTVNDKADGGNTTYSSGTISYNINPAAVGVWHTIWSKEVNIYHSSNGTKTCSVSSSWSNNVSPSSGSASGNFSVTSIPRTAAITLSVLSTSLISANIKASTDVSVSKIEYRVGNGGYITASTSSTTSYFFTISGLSPGTEYIITVRVTRKDSGLTSEKAIKATTKALASLSGSLNYTLGQDWALSFSNPGNGTINLSIKIADGATILRQNVSNPYTFSPTAEELDDMYAACPNTNTPNISFVVTTLLNGSSVGTKSQTGKAAVVNSNPAFPGFSVQDSNPVTAGLTGNTDKFIKGHSTADVSILPASGQNHATIVRYIISDGLQSAVATDLSGSLANVEGTTITVAAVDSRGNQTLVSKIIDMIDYTGISANPASADRANGADEETVLTLTGDGWYGNFGAVQNAVTLKYRFKQTNAEEYGIWITALPTFESNGSINFSSAVSGDLGPSGFDMDKSFDIDIIISDKLTTAQAYAIVDRAVATMCLYQDHAEFRGEIMLDGSTVSDFIIEQGTSGIWTYRKWNSGISECWGRHNYSNVSATTATGSFYYARLSFPDLPFVFKTVTDRHISCTNMINQIHWVSGDAPATANSVVLGKYYVFSPKSSTTLGGSIFICVTGTWK